MRGGEADLTTVVWAPSRFARNIVRYMERKSAAILDEDAGCLSS